MSRGIRTILSVSILIATLGWIVLSYLPPALVSLPQIRYLPDGVVRFFPALLVAGAVIFLALQVWIVQSTAASIRRYREDDQRQPATRFDLRVDREALLTAMPIAFTIALAIVSAGWWQRITAPF